MTPHDWKKAAVARIDAAEQEAKRFLRRVADLRTAKSGEPDTNHARQNAGMKLVLEMGAEGAGA